VSHLIFYYSECHCAECRYAECHYAECRGADRDSEGKSLREVDKNYQLQKETLLAIS
jgi:hypothetical protein